MQVSIRFQQQRFFSITEKYATTYFENKTAVFVS